MLNEKLTRANNETIQYKAQLAKYEGIKVTFKKEQSLEDKSDIILKSAEADQELPDTREVEKEIAATVRFVYL